MGERGRRYREAFEQFYRDDYSRIVYGVTASVGDKDVAADAVDEALARAWNRVRRGHDIDSIAAWVRVVAMNVYRDAHRKQVVEDRYRAALVRTQLDTSHEAWHLSVYVREVLSELSPRQREVAVLYVICDLPVATIASELGISVGTVKSMLSRARTALVATLRLQHDEEVVQLDAG
jgi:RNA polymerase sigma-70 factor (ECF subfamily)